MRYLKQGADTHVMVGPFVDFEDGVSVETGLVPADITCKRLRVESDEVIDDTITLSATANADNEFRHISGGWYEFDITGDRTSDNGDAEYSGHLIFTFSNASELSKKFVPLWVEFYVVPALVYDSLFAGDSSFVAVDRLQVDVRELGDANLALTTQMKADVNAECDTAVVGTAVNSPTAGSVGDLVQRVKKIQTNKWRVDEAASPPQLLIYDDNGSSVLYTFNLYASDGATGAHQNIYERHPV
jgi:hypothetical protein